MLVSDVMKIVLVVDENPQTQASLRDLIEEPRRMVITQRSGSEALQLIRIGMQVDAVVVSDGLQDMEVFQMFMGMQRLSPEVPVVMLLTPGPDAESLKSLSPGLFEYVEKTDIATDLKCTVDAVVELAAAPVEAGFRRHRSLAIGHGSHL